MQTLSEFIPRFRELGRREAIRQCSSYSTRIVTYEELHRLIGICMNFLRDHQLARGDRVMIQAVNSPEWVAMFWACIATGVQAVPIDFNFSTELASRIRSDCQAKHLIDAPMLESIRDRTGNSSPRKELLVVPCHPDDVVEIIYSSGTTGEPHGIVHRHRNICANLQPFEREISRFHRLAAPFQPIRILELLPLSHMFGQSMGLFLPVFLRGSVVFSNEIRPGALIRLVHNNRVSVIVSVPRMLESLRHEVERHFSTEVRSSGPRLKGIPGLLSRWWKYRRIHARFGWKFWAFVAGGARVEPDIEEFWNRLGFAVVQGYGLTEASPVVAVNHPFSSRKGSVGKPVPGQEIRIADDGEILVRGESIAGAVDAEGWLHTGDLGEIDTEGRLFYRGRKKDVIVTADGLNVSPQDVEAILAGIPEFKDSAVVGIDDQVHAALILRNPNTPRDLIEKAIRTANERLEAHQRIRHWSVWPTEDFPRTLSTMKVKRSAIAQQIRGGPLQPEATPDPSAMSSLERVELLTALEARHGIEIDEEAFSRAMSPEDMKQFISNPVEAQAAKPHMELSTWPMSFPFRLLRHTFQSLAAVPLFRNRIPFRVDGAGVLHDVRPPVIFAANHASDLDTPAIYAALPASWRRLVAPAVRANYFDKSWKLQIQYVLARLLFNVFPLPQEVTGTRRAFEYTTDLLRKGYCPLIFPEGRLTRDGKLQPFRPGVGMMAVRLQVPVVPIRIEGMFKVYSAHDSWPRSSPVRVVFLKQMQFTPQTKYEDAANAIREAIAAGGDMGTDT